MGRVIKNEVIAIRCEVATPRRGAPQCDAVETVWPVPAGAVWEDQVRDLARLVDAGWAFILTPTLRAYCPRHADRVWDCSCRTHPDRKHLCTSHGEAKDLVWESILTPQIVNNELERIGALT